MNLAVRVYILVAVHPWKFSCTIAAKSMHGETRKKDSDLVGKCRLKSRVNDIAQGASHLQQYKRDHVVGLRSIHSLPEITRFTTTILRARGAAAPESGSGKAIIFRQTLNFSAKKVFIKPPKRKSFRPTR